MTKTAATAIAEGVPADRRRTFLEGVSRNCETGVEGLQTFIDNFAGIDIYTEDEWARLDRILERARGFSAGLETGLAAVPAVQQEAGI